MVVYTWKIIFLSLWCTMILEFVLKVTVCGNFSLLLNIWKFSANSRDFKAKLSLLVFNTLCNKCNLQTKTNKVSNCLEEINASFVCQYPWLLDPNYSFLMSLQQVLIINIFPSKVLFSVYLVVFSFNLMAKSFNLMAKSFYVMT